MKRGRRSSSSPATPVAGVPAAGWLLVLVFFSGFAALVYELLWFRQLGLVFGNTVQAAATVLTAFMMGLAWGAHRARRWVERTSNQIRLFGLLEAGIGLYALLVPAAFALIRIAYQAAAQFLPHATPLLTGLRFVLALLVLLVPTMLMGASLPVLAEAALRSRERFATRLGLLYGSNTAGATAGVLACGFVLVPQIGVQASNWLAAGINLAVGLAAVLVARSAAPVPAPAAQTAPLARDRSTLGLLAVAALCGGLALAFETVWFRALVLVFGSTCYSFAIMVACFLLGIALGSGVLGRVANQPARAAWALAVALGGSGLWTLLSMRFYVAAPEQLLSILARFDFRWTGMLIAKASLAALFLLPLAILSGLAFTAVVRLIRDRTASAGSAVGAAFSVNALGSAAGSAAAGFLILPVLGLEKSLLLLGGFAILAGLAFAWWGTDAARPRRIAFMAALLVGAAGLRLGAPAWDPLLLSAGAYFSPRANVAGGKVHLRERLKSVELLYYHEGTTATVDVKRTADGRLYFSSDGKVEADTSPRSMTLQRMMAHAPMLLHPAPRRALNIGLGAGVTSGALTCYPGVEIEVAEIEPAVRGVAALWASRNHDLIARGAFTLRIDDGRNHLLTASRPYDVITSDPFEPVVAGAASLYTVEHFQLARSRLAPGGIMAQFLPLYEMSRADMLMILRSFVRVFPRTCVFFTGSDTVLVGLTDPAGLRLEHAAAKFQIPAVRASLAEIGVDRPERLLEMLAIDIHPGRQPVQDGPVNTDNLPIIEFSVPRSALEYHTDSNQKVLLDHFQNIPASYLEHLAPELKAEVQRGHAGLRTLLQASLLRSVDQRATLRLLTEAAQQAPRNPIIRTELAESLLLVAEQARTPAEAIPLYRQVLETAPGNFWALYHLVRLSDAGKQPAQGDEYLRQAFAAHPDAAMLLALRGRRAGLAGDNATACRDLEAAARKLPYSADIWQNYAFFLEQAGRTREAHAAAARAKALDRR